MPPALHVHMKAFGGPLKHAATQILFKVVAKEQNHNHTDIIKDDDNIFVALVLEHTNKYHVDMY